MATRAKRTIDPKKIGSLATWVENYKKKYGNLIVMNGRFLVLDPQLYSDDYEAALAAPAKVLIPSKAIDIEQVLADPDMYPQLRASAEEKESQIDEVRATAVLAAKTDVNKAEKELLDAAAAWEDVSLEQVSGGARRDLAMEVAKHTKALEEAEAALTRAIYPVRYIVAETGLLRNALNYASRDIRVFNEEVYRIVETTSRLGDRVIPYVPKEGEAVAAPVLPTPIPEMLLPSAAPERPTEPVNPVAVPSAPVEPTIAPAAPEGAVSAAAAGTAVFAPVQPPKRRASRKAKPAAIPSALMPSVAIPELPTANVASAGVSAAAAEVAPEAPREQSGGAVAVPAPAPVVPAPPAVLPPPAEEPKMLKILL
jgi:hypothetical protein